MARLLASVADLGLRDPDLAMQYENAEHMLELARDTKQLQSNDKYSRACRHAPIDRTEITDNARMCSGG